MHTRTDVINESALVRVTLGKDEYMARVVGTDPDKDIAVLQVSIVGSFTIVQCVVLYSVWALLYSIGPDEGMACVVAATLLVAAIPNRFCI